MDIIKIINESFSINDLATKLYGYSNGRTNKKTIEVLEQNGFDKSFFDGKSKNRKYQKIKIICPICFVEFETTENGKKTCSSSCSNSYYQHGKNNPDFDKEKYEERYKKVSNTLKEKHLEPWNKGIITDYGTNKICLECKVEFKSKKNNQVYCSINCMHKSPDYKQKLRDSVRERIKNGTHKGWQSRNIESYPEKFFKKVLKNNGIEYETNKTIIKKDYNIEGNGNYFLDFYIKEGNIDLEIDGKQHDYRVEHDIKRDDNLSKHFNIYRIKWKSINNETGKQYIKKEIEKFIKYYNKMKNLTLQPQQQIIKPD